MCAVIEGETSAVLELYDVGLQLRRLADVRIRTALRISALAIAGYKPAEIRERLGLSASEWREARAWLRDAIATTDGDG